MSYYTAKTIHTTFDEAIQRITNTLAAEGFGILTEIDVKATFKKKLDIDFRNYRILGACNPQFAHKAITAENKIGTMLPCSVIVQELEPGTIEIAAIDPVASMQAVNNPALHPIADEVQAKLARAIESL